MADQISSNGHSGGPQEVYVVLRRAREFPYDSWTMSRVLDDGGYEAARTAVTTMTPDQTIELAKDSGLRGRGGAGFPTGMKWSFVPKDVFPKYIVVNHDEGEPGTFKDREIAERDPHGLIEGIIIAAWANQASKAFIYCRGEFALGGRRMDRAIREAYDKGFLGRGIFGSKFDLDIVLTRGAGAYICGEESALLDSLEGFRGQPRLRPPFPAVKGLYGQPTVINNTETLATLPAIVKNGASWFKQWGPEKSPGTKVMSVSGHVNKPGNYEVPLGMSLGDILTLAGGMKDGKKLKAVIPGGASAPLLTDTNVAMDFDSLKDAGTMLGSGAIVFMDEDTCMVRNALVTAHFFEHESCGKCTPCREGTWWKVKVLERIEHGEGRQEDMDLLLDICDGMDGRSFCPLGDASAWAIRSNVKLFREEFERHVALGRCPANDDEDMLVGAHMGRGPAMVGVGAGEAGVTPQPSSGISVDGPTPSGAPSFTPSGGENVTSRREPLAQPEPVKELEPAAQAQPEPVKPEPVREPEPVAQIETPAAEEAPAEPEYEPGSYSKPPVDAATASEGPHDPFSFHKLEPPTRSRGPESTAEPKATPEPEPTREPERSPEPQASVEPEESREPGALAASETEQVAEPEAHQAEQTKEAEPVATATESSAEADPHTATPEQPHEPEAAAPAAGPTRRLRSPQHRIDEETS